jgi:hypothetical protein
LLGNNQKKPEIFEFQRRFRQWASLALYAEPKRSAFNRIADTLANACVV